MAQYTLSQRDHSQSKKYTHELCNESIYPLPSHNPTVHMSKRSSPFSGSREVEFTDNYGVEFLSSNSGCSSGFQSVSSPSACWHLSNPGSGNIHFLPSVHKTAENCTGLVDLSGARAQLQAPDPHEASHAQCSNSSDFPYYNTKIYKEGWQPLLDRPFSYMSAITSVLPTPNSIALPTEITENHALVGDAMLKELPIGRFKNNHPSSGISSLGTTHATGSVEHIGSAVVTGAHSWSEVTASSNIGQAADSSKRGLLNHETHGLIFTSHDCSPPLDPGFGEHAAQFSSFSNIGEHCRSISSSDAFNMNLSPEATHLLYNLISKQTSMTTPNCLIPQNSPKVSCNVNACNNYHTCENADKVMSSVHDLFKELDITTELDAGEYRSRSDQYASCHLVVAIDDTNSMQSGASPANSSCSDQYALKHSLKGNGGLTDTLGKKRQRFVSEGNDKEVFCLEEDSKKKIEQMNSTRQRSWEALNIKTEHKSKAEKSITDNSIDSTTGSAKYNPKPPEPPKQDYIHVRARRGQATDSHSLAERGRREKISERLKLLQDLVPGCSKVTRKTLILDQIINYIQSLQHQVEFLSMRLASVNTRLDFNIENLTKEL